MSKNKAVLTMVGLKSTTVFRQKWTSVRKRADSQSLEKIIMNMGIMGYYKLP